MIVQAMSCNIPTESAILSFHCSQSIYSYDITDINRPQSHLLHGIYVVEIAYIRKQYIDVWNMFSVESVGLKVHVPMSREEKGISMIADTHVKTGIARRRDVPKGPRHGEAERLPT
jgi:hypothetical protein